MQIQAPQRNPLATPTELALQLSDALVQQGDRRRATALLELVAASGETDERLALRRADSALEQGNAPEALKLLARVWETGSLDPRVEAMLALCALAVGMTDVTESLTADPERSLDHAAVRLLLAAARGERVRLEGVGGSTETMFLLRTHLRTLAHCGRADLVDAFSRADLGLPSVHSLIHGLAMESTPTREVASPSLEATRADFVAAWRGPAPHASANWAWTIGREIAGGERTLLLSPWPDAFATALAHARVTRLSPVRGPGVEIVADPEHLPVAPGRFQHIVAAGWLGHALNPEAALRELTRACGHEAQVHLVSAGPAAAGDADVTLSVAALERLAARVGLSECAGVARMDDGLPATPARAEVIFVRGVRRCV
jgi:hypothetical protein